MPPDAAEAGVVQLSVKVIIRDADGRVLLLRRAPSSRMNAGRWDFPGGKVDPGENIASAATREVLEETGCEVRITGVAGAGESRPPGRIIAYLFLHAECSAPPRITISAEHDAHAWVEPHALLSHDLCPQFRAMGAALAAAQPIAE